MAEATKQKKKRGMPTSFTILLGCLIFVAICTWIVAAFTPDVTGATLAQVMQAPFSGFKNAIDVCLFVIVLGGFLAMVNKTGALIPVSPRSFACSVTAIRCSSPCS